MNCRLNTSSRSESARQCGHADCAGLTNTGTPAATLGGRRDRPEWCGSHEAKAIGVGTTALSGRSMAGSSDERRISARQEALFLQYDRSDEQAHGGNAGRERLVQVARSEEESTCPQFDR